MFQSDRAQVGPECAASLGLVMSPLPSPSASETPLRVRFAPSPTGFFHVGGARTALYNWLLAKRLGGTFILRIEDTDAERNREEWVQGIHDALAWIGIGPGLGVDYEVYRQSEFEADHVRAAHQLLGARRAYYCACTREQLDTRNEAAGRKQGGYDGHCREKGLAVAPAYVVRFKVPRPGVTVVNDVIRGEPAFDHANVDDFVLLRGNGTPMFLLANVVDDMSMGVTLVIRAEEHLTNTPKQQLLWQALDAPYLPTWAHVPVLVNEKRQKLSKRRDPVAMEMYRDEGYLPEAMKNYLMLLGWSPGNDAEIMEWSLVESLFSLDEVNSSPAFFDVKKLRAFNADYIRALPQAEFVERWHEWLAAHPQPWEYRADQFGDIAPFVQLRAEVLGDIPAVVDFLFGDVTPSDADWDKAMKPPADAILTSVIDSYDACSWDIDVLKAELERIGDTHGLKLGKIQAPVRLAITGKLVGPPLFESLHVLGRERAVGRLKAARARL